MLAEILEIILSPVGLAVGVIYAVLSQVILQSLNLIFGKSKDAILRFTTERSKNQKELRRKRVLMMGTDIKAFHIFLAQLNFHLHMGTLAMVLAGVSALGMVIVRRASTFNDPTMFLILAWATALVGIYNLFEALAIQQDSLRVIDKRKVDNDDDDKAPL